MATKIKRKYKNAINAGDSPDKEIVTGASQTVPNQALSVREIMRRSAAGTLPDLGTGGTFTEDLPDLRGYDISELYDMAAEHRTSTARMVEEQQRQEAATRADNQRKKIIADHEASKAKETVEPKKD